MEKSSKCISTHKAHDSISGKLKTSIDVCSALKLSHFIPTPQILTKSLLSPKELFYKRQIRLIIKNCYILLEDAHCLYLYILPWHTTFEHESTHPGLIYLKFEVLMFFENLWF